jgi:hypothetical protein
LKLTSDLERGVLVPLFTRQYALAKDRQVILGWTSWGSGEQSDHAWIVEVASGTVRIASTLKLSAHRADTFFVLHRDEGRVRIGVPPERDASGIDEPWVTLNGKPIEAGDASTLPSSPAPAAGEVECFGPPMGLHHVPNVPLVWFAVEPGGFRRL